MEFSLAVVDVTNDMPNVIKLKGDVEATIELPLEKLGVVFSVGDRLKLVLQKEKDQDLNKYKVYAWGIVYYVGNGMTRISIGGLQLDIMKELPLKAGEKIYVGIL
ncbi:hypothetical protein [Pyrobaculum aerophilum]|uniref:Uncharacterized protein n=2 Tax=Pyrobaculum aerophilum TaxID=13773 RepID=Q8ZVU3_PYRAE|nr:MULTISPECIES: hypothetical protein [Pyrobaculum]AAL63961.1 hypothetical protein PAE2121 [Pyrobaculum aerophilum str. IM2]MCX8137889.1 hypothetical protein [Pyrobaculum aerophilum]RFA93971.1 hypothetical protein CGL51_11575 [Pyrobaculum aerophilum]RFA97210.1 hypothetical protein CGL52_09870 [Pyrobaculum aerophilum]HII46482.1 hypothetical protein [Pyrobaculum aerophilum]